MLIHSVLQPLLPMLHNVPYVLTIGAFGVKDVEGSGPDTGYGCHAESGSGGPRARRLQWTPRGLDLTERGGAEH